MNGTSFGPAEAGHDEESERLAPHDHQFLTAPLNEIVTSCAATGEPLRTSATTHVGQSQIDFIRAPENELQEARS